MLKFIVYDDLSADRSIIKKIITDTMSKTNMDYKIEEFGKYDSKMKKVIDEECHKIYIMDIEIPEGMSGIDVSRRIRINDWNSSIILVTTHSDMGYEALKAQIMVLDFISKFNNCQVNLSKAIKKALSKINNKKVLIFETSEITYKVYTDDIIYILKDSIDRKSIIKTEYNEISVNETITNLSNMLDDRFFITHRSCIINTEKINKIDWKNSIIYFRNGETIDYLSRDKKKGLKEYVRSC